MQFEQVKVCPSCEAEYRPDIESCADCGDALVHPSELARISMSGEIKPGEELVTLRTAPFEWCTGLARQLREHGIPSILRVEPPASEKEATRGWRGGYHERGPLYSVLVGKGDRSRAATVDLEHETSELPSASGASQRWSAESCPGCGKSIEKQVEECPDCGLLLAELDG